MVQLDTREWLLTNGLGSFASGTVSDVRTRTYHGWLFSATNPPSGRRLLLSHLEASLELPGQIAQLGTNFWASGQVQPTGYQLLNSFEINPVPRWIWGEENWQLTRSLFIPHGYEGTWDWRVGSGGGYGVDKGVIKSSSSPSYSSSSSSPPLPTPHSPLPTPHSPFPTPHFPFCDRILIQYRYEGKEVATLKLRLLVADRDFHYQQRKTSDIQFSQQFMQLCTGGQVSLQAIISGSFGTPWNLRWTGGEYRPEEYWYWNYGLPEETRRGLSDKEDLFTPGYLKVTMQPGDTVTLEARVGFPNPTQPPLTSETFAEAIETEKERLSQIFALSHPLSSPSPYSPFPNPTSQLPTPTPNSQLPTPNSQLPAPHSPLPNSELPTPQMWQKLLHATEQFIVYRASVARPSVIAGYHWFNDWGRGTLIALPGLTLVTKRFDLARSLLQTFGGYCRNGLIPNAFPDIGDEPAYNSIDTALWWIEALGLYLEATKDWDFLAEQYPVVQQIYKAFIGGTRYNIQVDSIDGLIGWDAHNVALTWMDVVIEGKPVTPRRGKPVEINALWYSALCWASRWAEILSEYKNDGDSARRFAKQARRYTLQAQQVQISLQKYWNQETRYLFDTIEPDDRRNSQIRPNAVLALSLRHCAFSHQQGQAVLRLAVKSLLTPYGLRSLDPNDPEYIGKYVGNPQQRDLAYHQGTVWSWLIGPFIRAWERFYDQECTLPFDWQPLMTHFLSEACINSISEIFDGDPPHTPRGAIAQAWSIAEIIRHFGE
ncbi:MAG: amylo-alpha-1,6-glucosidase [Scytonematopsis contorta HA4267-MV1]|nr:amylo-alpha-1,6-glucosidase [Scytonematopsis contorta HA4267-MV1]